MLVVKYKCMVAMVLFITLRYLKVTQVTKKKDNNNNKHAFITTCATFINFERKSGGS